MKIMISLSHPYITNYKTLKHLMPHLIETKVEYGLVTADSLRLELLEHGIKGEDADRMIERMLDILKKDPQVVC